MPQKRTKPQDFRAIFDTHVSFVWRVLKRYGIAESELEDGCQEVFLVVHRRLPEFEGRSSLRTWIYGIARLVALSMRRRAQSRSAILEQTQTDMFSQPPQLEATSQRQMLHWVEAALSELSADKREAFVLYELEAMSLSETAMALGVPENTALYRLYGAREAIRRFVERRRRLSSVDRKSNLEGRVAS